MYKKIKSRVVFPYSAGGNISKFFFIPEIIREYNLSGVAPGGEGGLRYSTTISGGGGGAGGFIDRDVILQPNSVVELFYNATTRKISVFYQEYGNPMPTTVMLHPGLPGGNASSTAAGVGGYSGMGCAGGINGSNDSKIPEGLLDVHNRAHSCGGWAAISAAWGATVNAYDWAYSHGASASLQSYANKFHSPMGVNVANTPGAGGCSYFGNGGSVIVGVLDAPPGFGGGGAGEAATQPGNQMGGDGFFQLSWDA